MTATSVYVGSKDAVTVYDTMTRRKKESIPASGYINDISISRDDKSLFVAYHDGTASIVNIDTRKEVILDGHESSVRCIIQGEGTDVLTCSDDKTIRRWNSLTGECLKIYKGHTDWVSSVLYDETTKRIFSASDDATIIVWNGETGEKIGVMEGHGNWVRSLTRVNSTTIASGSCDRTIKIWDMNTLICIKTISNGSMVQSVAATPDGQHLISGSYDEKVRVWSVATGQCLHMLSHHSGKVTGVAVSPCGRFIASDGATGRLFLTRISPSFSFVVHKDVTVNEGREIHLCLLSDGAIRDSSDLIATVTSTSTCSIVSENKVVIHGIDSVEFTAPSVSSAQLWSDAISAVAADLVLHHDDRAHSAVQLIRRYRFNLLQTVLVHVREADFRKNVPREIVHIIGSYCFKEKEKPM
jgi:WD40 repeat protein